MASQTYCHFGSIQNYFSSPKMPIKDHLEGLKSTSSSFKHTHTIIDHKTKKVLGDHTGASQHIGQILKMKQMKLMNPKQLHIVNHSTGKENTSIGSHHDRQTNPGYSRNKLGGFFTS